MGPALKILLVEDNDDHAELITRSLTRSLPDMKIKHALHSQDCLSLLDKKTFDIVLMDYYLKDTLGLDLLRQVGKQHPEVPVVIITGQGDERTAAKSIKAGAEDYVVKTRESLEALPKIITRTIQKHKSRKFKKAKTAASAPSHPQMLSSVFREIEQISLSLKSIYRRLNGNGIKKVSAKKDLKRLPLLEKQMLGLKQVMKKLFGGR
jgi:DNA-binding NtrC family response regulator